jgi:PAS domain S-box-containing protein
MYVPVYRNGMPANTIQQRRAAIIGWVYSPYRMNDLMEGILGRWDLIQEEKIHLQVYDSIVSTDAQLFDSQANDSLQHSDIPYQRVDMPIVFNGQKWILSFSKSQEQAFVSGKVFIILASGILISLLIFALSLSLFNTLFLARQKASELTTEIKVSEERFGILLNSTAEGIYGIDLHGKCTFSNISCHQQLGYQNAGHLLGKNMHQLIHHSNADGSSIEESKCLIYTSFIKEEKAHSSHEVFWRADGSCFPVEYWSEPVFINGKIEGSVVTFFDITERLKAEKEILEAKDEAEKANSAKSEFLARMSHELRTPLNSILGFAQLMDMGDLNPKQKKNTNHILTSGKYLLQLIDEVLDISRIESGKLALSAEPVNITLVIHELMDSIRPQILERQLSLEFDDQANNQLSIEADIKRLKQVLLNLLSNAAKYNISGGMVHIKTEIMPPNGNLTSLRISITNSGEAISSENTLKLFAPFERIGAERTEIKGTGLGLTVVKKLMDAIGGKVGVVSKPGQGNTFWIELPSTENQKKPEAQNQKNEEPATTPMPADNQPIPQPEDELEAGLAYPPKTGTVLYIEDNILGVELVRNIIGRYHPQIKLITTMFGENAVQMAVDHQPELILLDLNLPDLHGSKVFANLKSDVRTSTIPVVIISTDALPVMIEELMQAGAKAYLTKPFNIVSLLKAVDEWIGNGSKTGV